MNSDTADSAHRKSLNLERKLARLGTRPAKRSAADEAARLVEYLNAAATSALDNDTPPPPHRDRLFRLLASGRLTTAACFRLCRQAPI